MERNAKPPRGATALFVLKIVLVGIGIISIWTLRAYPWWFLLFSSVTVTIFAIAAVRTYRKDREGSG